VEVQKLPNYIRAHRKRQGFSQRQLAFLLHCRSEAKLSRYEHFIQVPTLPTAIRLAIILDVPVQELFAGTYRNACRDTAKRASLMAKRVTGQGTNSLHLRRLATLGQMNIPASR